MASTYSNLKIELIGTGEQVGTWGATTNANLGTAIEEAIVGSADVSFSSSDVTLTLTNSNASQAARHIRLNLTGTSGGARNLILGSGCQIDKPYIVNNGLADAVTVKNTTGTGVTVPVGRSMWVFNDGTNVVDAVTHVNATVTGNVTGNLTGNVTGNVTGNLTGNVTGNATNVTGVVAIANGGTNASTEANARTNLGLGTASNVQFNSLGVGTPGSATAGEIRATNNVTAFYSSDAKFKENVRDIDAPLDKVLAIGGKYFDWTDDYIRAHGGEDGYFVSKADFGVIAQDVQKAFPVAVKTREDGSLAVDYEKLCALAFAAIAELNKKIDAKGN
jgi:hypothetical protein